MKDTGENHLRKSLTNCITYIMLYRLHLAMNTTRSRAQRTRVGIKIILVSKNVTIAIIFTLSIHVYREVIIVCVQGYMYSQFTISVRVVFMARCSRYNIIYVIQFVSDLRRWFSPVSFIR
jgi:hypothetical protein